MPFGRAWNHLSQSIAKWTMLRHVVSRPDRGSDPSDMFTIQKRKKKKIAKAFVAGAVTRPHYWA